jgi:cell division protein ZapA (FtsZ GTPase activity inhibitor)
LYKPSKEVEMSKLPLKIVVAGRTYPLTVNEGEDDKIIKAAEDINRAIKMLQENYAVKDMQDLLAMTALQLATKTHGNQNSTIELEQVENKLENLLNSLSSH